MDALILVDLQNDFMDDGALPVRDAYDVIPVANHLMPRFAHVVATQDWHPRGHGSFAANHPGREPYETVELHGLTQVLWPVHCVQGEDGAELVHGLDAERIDAVFRKGQDPTVDSYSGFFDNGRRAETGLAGWLRARGVRRVFVCGVATDYCVKFTALDAVREGFATVLVADACRGVDARPGDVERAIAELLAAGVLVRTTDTLPDLTVP